MDMNGHKTFKKTYIEEVYNIIKRLHHKTLPENNTIHIPSNTRQLQPRRRIHKIIKGYDYSDNYNEALEFTDIIKNCINNHPELKSEMNRNKLIMNLNLSHHSPFHLVV